MQRLILIATIAFATLAPPASAQEGAQLVTHLKQVYGAWRNAMIKKNARSWQKYTALSRQVTIQNRIFSEKKAFPNAVFAAPGSPPNINRLRALRVRVNKRTAKAIYYGPVDFGVGGKPTNNIFIISYVKEADGWKYDRGEFVKLDVIPEVRKEIESGDLKFVDTKDFMPDGIVPIVSKALRGPVKYIAKTYVYCGGHEVKLVVNNRSEHLYQNTKASEIVIGGARDGVNEVKYTIKKIPGGDPKVNITIRVYLMSQVPGSKPIKAAEYEIRSPDNPKPPGPKPLAGAFSEVHLDGRKPKASGTMTFTVTPEIAKLINGGR